MASFGKAHMGCQTMTILRSQILVGQQYFPDQALCWHLDMVHLLQPARLTRFIFLRD